MRWSDAFIPTLRDAPADAEAVSHVLLVRGGFIRQLAAGSYTILPLGMRVRLKVAGIIREEMNAIGGQEMMPPTLHPAEIWRKSGRYELMGENLFKLMDRKDAELVLGMTEEEIFALTAMELFSYRDLPPDLVSDAHQVPRRGPAEVGSASSARVHDEGLLHPRHRPGRARCRL